MTPEQRRKMKEVRRRTDRAAWTFFGCLVFVIILVGLFAGCRPRAEVTTHVTDSVKTSVEVTHRDTVFQIAGDSAHVTLDTDVAAIDRLLSELKKEKRVIRGERNAAVVLANDNGRLAITARCDSVEILLENAITTIQSQRETLHSKETTIAVQAERMKGAIPGWMKGVALMAVAIAASAGTLMFLFKKLLFKPR